MSEAENDRVAALERQVGELRAALAETLAIVEALAAKAGGGFAQQAPSTDAHLAETVRRLRDRLSQASRS